MTTKTNILTALTSFVNTRPGLEYALYGDPKLYRNDYRRILQAKHDYSAMLSVVLFSDDITAKDILEASERAYSGRLSITVEGDNVEINYTAGQYMPTEYRNAACAVLASVLWSYWRRDETLQTGDALRAKARRTFGRGIVSRWFA